MSAESTVDHISPTRAMPPDLHPDNPPRVPGGKPSGGQIRARSGSGMSTAGIRRAISSGGGRRSSTRSIKRKKFDDEIVESSGGVSATATAALRMRSYSVNALATSGVNEPLRRRGRVGRRSRRPRSASSMTAASDGLSSTATAHNIGRWKPSDDLALILSTQQTCDLLLVHLGVKFSCMFTLREIQERWQALLFDASVSQTAVEAMCSLSQEQVSEIESRVLYSADEERLLKNINSGSPPSIEQLQTLIDSNLSMFHASRTPQRLRQYWNQLREYQLLDDQTPERPRVADDQLASFSDVEESIDDTDLLSASPEHAEAQRELRSAESLTWRHIDSVDSLTRGWQVLVDRLTGVSQPTFGSGTLAILRGRTVRYLMCSSEVTVGRSCSSSGSTAGVDIDLSLEGLASKVSRRQAIIRLLPDGRFALANIGRRAIYVDGKPVVVGAKRHIDDQAVIQLAALKFVFFINQPLVNSVKHKQSWSTDSSTAASNLDSAHS